MSLRPWLQQKDVDVLFGVAPAVPEIRAFDFSAPPRLPRERRAVLDGALERLAPSVASLLSSRLRKAVEVVPGAVELVRAGELVNALPVPCAAYPFVVGDSHGVADVGLPFALYHVERMFGGAGESQVLERALTQLEQNALSAVVGTVPGLVRDAFRVSSIATQAGACEPDPMALPFPARDEILLVLRLDVKTSGLECQWMIALPLAELETLFAVPDESSAPAHTVSPESARELQQAHVTLVARLPLFRMTARDLSEVAVGETLPCGHSTETPAEVLVNGCIRFRGSVGQVRGKLGLRITETVVTPTPARPARDREGRAL